MNGDIHAGRKFMKTALKSDFNNEQIYEDLAVTEMKANNLNKAKHYVLQGKKYHPMTRCLIRLGKWLIK